MNLPKDVADPVERPETFEPFEKWKNNWTPPEGYITLREAFARYQDQLVEFLPFVHCLGFTMHVQRDLPSTVWEDPQWKWNPIENTCGQPQYAEHLQFQVAVHEEQLENEAHRPVPDTVQQVARGDTYLVENVEGMEELLPDGWEMHTVEGVAWQAVRPRDYTFSPMRARTDEAVADAWRKESKGFFLPEKKTQ